MGFRWRQENKVGAEKELDWTARAGLDDNEDGRSGVGRLTKDAESELNLYLVG